MVRDARMSRVDRTAGAPPCPPDASLLRRVAYAGSGSLSWTPFAERVMIGSIVRVVIYGLLGLVGLPIATTLLVLALSHAFDPRCGTPGDSGGCEMGAVSFGVLAALPGLAIGVALAIFQEWRKRPRG